MFTLLIVFFLIAILFSFLCSMWEAVLLSVTPAYARVKLDEGTDIGRHLQAFKQDIDRPLAAILTLNTIAHTVGAIGVGNQAAAIWSDANPLITALAIPVAMTLAILILSEIIPKTLGANYWQELAPFTVRSLLIIIKVLAPLVWFSELITQVLKKDKSKSIFSRTDFMALAEIGARDGVIDHGESKIIANLLRFDRVAARDIMTPRTVVMAGPIEMSLAEFERAHPGLRFSRIPVYQDDNKDHVVGFVLKSELLAAIVDGRGEEPLDSIKRELMVVREETTLPEVFSRLVGERAHIALVRDEYGGMAGIVTMEDVIETLLGLEIVDETDGAADMQVLARRSWERRARAMGLVSNAPSDDA